MLAGRCLRRRRRRSHLWPRAVRAGGARPPSGINRVEPRAQALVLVRLWLAAGRAPALRATRKVRVKGALQLLSERHR